MPPERWENLQELFHQAMDLAPGEREAWLEQECGDDKALLNDALALIAGDSKASDTLHNVIGDAARGIVEGGAKPNSRIGSYRVLRELGHGGMGRVVLAERDDDVYRQQVAIKLLRSSVLSDEAIRLFQAERQTLARLSHPNIAVLMDGGATDDGTPYVVMQYVDGKPLVDYAEENDLSIRERLQLFLKVCAAVSHAHRNLIVHRDVKPSNILVDSDGEPKLLDFGIAKMLEAPTAAAKVTQAGLMTPAYASPEQVDGLPITVSTDVYSLGAVLFELLTGQPPFEMKNTSPSEMASIIRNTAPPLPSEAVMVKSIAARELRGDLDNIVHKAMRKEPERRYAGVPALSEDIEAYLQNRPVAARADTLTYRLHKFVTRNAAMVTVVAMAVVALVAGSSYYTLSLQAERDRAEESLQRADNSLEFLTSLFRDVAPKVTRGEKFSAVDLLDRGRERIANELVDFPLSQGYLMGILGEVYYELGDYETSRQLHHDALLRHETAEASNPQELWHTLMELSRAYLKLNRNLEADVHTQRAIELQETFMPPDDPQRITPLQRVCNSLYAQARYEEALPYCLQTVEIARLPTTTRIESLSSALNGLANVYIETGDYDAALANYIESQQIDINELGIDHPWSSISTSNVAYTYRRMQRFEEALEAYQLALEIAEKVWPVDHPDTRRIYTSIALTYRITGRFAEAEALLQPKIDEFETTNETGGWAYADMLRLQEVAGNFDKMLEMGERYLWHVQQRDDSHNVVEAQDLIVRALIGQQQYTDAERRLAEFQAENAGSAELLAESAPLMGAKAYLLGLADGEEQIISALFDSALAIAGHHEREIRLLRARSLATRGLEDEARAEMRTLIEMGFEDRFEYIPDLAALNIQEALPGN